MNRDCILPIHSEKSVPTLNEEAKYKRYMPWENKYTRYISMHKTWHTLMSLSVLAVFWWLNHEECSTRTHFTNVHALCASFYSQPPHLSLLLWHKTSQNWSVRHSPPHILFFLEFFNILVQVHALTLVIGMTQSINFVIPTVYILPRNLEVYT